MKKSDRDAWTARLRDPASKQAQYAGVKGYDAYPCKDGSLPMCCLGHGQFVLDGEVTNWYDEAIRSRGISNEQLDTLMRLNDSFRMPLSQIADWIEANIPITE